LPLPPCPWDTQLAGEKKKIFFLPTSQPTLKRFV